MLNLHLAVAHSFSKHIYVGVGGQVDAKEFPYYFQDTARNFTSFSANALGGYFKRIANGNMIDISLGWAYEKMDEEGFKLKSFEPEYSESNHARYNVPFVQFSYCFKGESSNTFLTIRTSGIFKDKTKEEFNANEGILYRVYAPYAMLISPSVQFSFKNAKAVPFFITANISTKKGENGIGFAPPFQAGIKFMIQ